MLNLYANAIDKNGFMGLVSNQKAKSNKVFEKENRRILSTFAVMSLIVLAAVANGAQFQQNIELAEVSKIASHTFYS